MYAEPSASPSLARRVESCAARQSRGAWPLGPGCAFISHMGGGGGGRALFPAPGPLICKPVLALRVFAAARVEHLERKACLLVSYLAEK